MKTIKLLLCTLAVTVLASCSVVKHGAYAPDRIQMNIELSDLVFLGETEISVEYDTYLGIFSRIDKINGEPYDGKVYETATEPEKKYSEEEMNGISKKNSEKAVAKVLKELGITDRVKAIPTLRRISLSVWSVTMQK